jgi:hypothetical protein
MFLPRTPALATPGSWFEPMSQPFGTTAPMASTTLRGSSTPGATSNSIACEAAAYF